MGSTHPKLSIEKVENGFVVRIIREGYTSTFKASYEKAILVFMHMDDLLQFLRIWAATSENKRPTVEAVEEVTEDDGDDAA